MRFIVVPLWSKDLTLGASRGGRVSARTPRCTNSHLGDGRLAVTNAQQPQRGLQIRPSLMMIPWPAGAGAPIDCEAIVGVDVAADDGVAMTAAATSAVGSARNTRVRVKARSMVRQSFPWTC